jgi:hypothetical protein
MPQGAAFGGERRAGGNPNGTVGGKSSGSSSGPRANAQAQVNRAYQSAPAAAPAMAGNATVADRMIATGQVRAPSIPAAGVAQGNYATQGDAYNQYATAVGDYATRSLAGRIGAALAGPFVDQQEPMAGNPRSFSHGTYHTTSNPGGIVGSMAPMGIGSIAGPALGAGYTAAGLPEVWHGGNDQPDIRNGIFGNAPPGYDMGKSFDDMGGTHAEWGFGGGGPTPPGGNQTGGGNMTAFPAPVASAPGGAPFGAQPTPAAPTGQPSPAAGLNGLFSPRLPNHSLPQGFQSAFPNSLSDADKALLYAKALGGGA